MWAAGRSPSWLRFEAGGVGRRALLQVRGQTPRWQLWGWQDGGGSVPPGGVAAMLHRARSSRGGVVGPACRRWLPLQGAKPAPAPARGGAAQEVVGLPSPL